MRAARQLLITIHVLVALLGICRSWSRGDTGVAFVDGTGPATVLARPGALNVRKIPERDPAPQRLPERFAVLEQAARHGDGWSILDSSPPAWLTRAGTSWQRETDRNAPVAVENFRNDLWTNLDATYTRLSATARIDVTGANPWALAWSGNYEYSGGVVAPGEDGSEDGIFTVSSATVQRRFHDVLLVRAGRYLPPELSEVGTIDGVQGEISLGGALRVGVVGGTRPDAATRQISAAESVAAAYVSSRLGQEHQLFHKATLGAIATMYRGQPDRLVLLARQRVDLSARLRLYGTTEVDVDILEGSQSDVWQLTGSRVEAVSPVTSRFTARVGVDHRKLVRTRSAGELLPSENDSALDRGNWRYWIGGSYRLPWNLHVDGEWSLLDTHDTVEHDRRWRASVQRAGLPLLPGATIQATAYNLDGRTHLGCGGRLTAHLPILDGGISLSPGIGYRFLQPDTASDFQVTDLSITARWRGSDTFSLHATARYSFVDVDVDEQTVLEMGLRLAW